MDRLSAVEVRDACGRSHASISTGGGAEVRAFVIYYEHYHEAERVETNDWTVIIIVLMIL